MIRTCKKYDLAPAALILMSILMWGVLHILTGISALGPSAYNSYTLQALSWLNGRTDVDNREYLELAIYEGKYYVSFPPLPSAVLLPLTLIFSSSTPDNLLVKIYALAALLMIYRVLKNAGCAQAPSALFAFLCLFGSSLLPLTLEGAVWYHAQVLAMMNSVLAVCLIALDKPNMAIVFYALSVACRPFDAVYGVVIASVYISISLKGGLTLKSVFKKVLPGIACGAAVAVMLGVYNYIRFNNPLEFGHNYLPEFSFQGGKQFSLGHVGQNISNFVLRLPFKQGENGIEMERFGFSFLIACPFLTMLLIWFVRDIFTRNMTVEKVIIVIAFFAHFLLLLCHRTFGGYQYGARYCVDLTAYALMYRLCDQKHRARVALWEWLLPAAGFILALYGAVNIHL